MKRHLSVLFIDSSGQMGGPILDCLRAADYETSHEQVGGRNALLKALGQEQWDAVFANSGPGELSALVALDIVKSKHPEVPFIVVSGSPHDTIAAEAMGHGAHDSVLLSNLSRLVAAVERGIHRADNAKQRSRAADASERYKEYLEGLVQARTMELKQAIEKLMLEVESHKSTVETLVREKSDELAKAHQELANAKRLSDIGNLAATVAHELRNPLSVMQTALYNIRRKRRDEAIDRHLDNIERKIQESSQIINNLMSYARVGAPELQKSNLSRIIDQSLALSAQEFSRSKVKLERDLKAIANLELEVDPAQINQVFVNVLSNAYQAVSEGGHIKISAALERTAQMALITFSDDGVGIPGDQIGRVFDPFFTTRTHGTGLGLTISRDIISHHGGEISIQSKEGGGTSVTVALPVR
ncbi:MAG TPA: ATP-binding protein [bacterium]|nr:ATP-binding protein [bacterium]